MKKCFGFVIIMFLVCLLGVNVYAQQAPKGAKALFDSGEGTTVKMSSGPRVSAPTQAATPAKYVGISYKLVLLRPDGRFDIVPKSRIFRSGERLKLLVRTNKPGYLTILNIGTSGSTNVLHNDYVEAMSMIEIPRTGNFRFTGDPGTEKLLKCFQEAQIHLVLHKRQLLLRLPRGHCHHLQDLLQIPAIFHHHLLLLLQAVRCHLLRLQQQQMQAVFRLRHLLCWQAFRVQRTLFWMIIKKQHTRLYHQKMDGSQNRRAKRILYLNPAVAKIMV